MQWVCFLFHLPFQTDPVQHSRRLLESLCLHVRVSLCGKPNDGVPRQLLGRERILGLVTEYPFAPGLRSPVTSCPNLSLPVHLREDLTG